MLNASGASVPNVKEMLGASAKCEDGRGPKKKEGRSKSRGRKTGGRNEDDKDKEDKDTVGDHNGSAYPKTALLGVEIIVTRHNP